MGFERAIGGVTAVILAGMLASCGETPDAATRCANRVADMFGVGRDKVGLGGVLQRDDGTSSIGGAVDAKFWSDGTRAFECRFDENGHLDVEIMASDSE